VDTYSSLAHTRGWNAPGPWALKINWNITDDSGAIRYAALFELGGYITIGNDGTKCGIITSIEKAVDDSGKQGQDVTISGYEPTVIFNRRMVDVPSGQDFYTLNAAAETVIKTVISDQAGSTATNIKRAFPLLSIAADQGRGDTYLLSVAYTELLAELTNCSISTRLGWFMTLDRTNKLLVLDCALGNDLTAGNNPQAVFSTNYDTLKSATLNQNVEQYKNVATVAGQGTGQLRTVLDVYDGTEPSGVDRYEVFVNANNLTTTPDLTAKGSQAIDTYSYTKTLDASILAKSPLVYGENYNLGDFVTVAAYDYSENVQITAIQESWEPLLYDLIPTFDKAPATISTQMATSTKNQGAVVGNLGYPTSGSNANGSYIKFPDGTMCQRGSVTVTTNTGFGTNFYANVETAVTFPVPFTAVPDSIITGVNATTNVGSAFISNRSGSTPVSSTGFGANVWMSANSTAFTVYWTAWGRWK
jgi:hypothetical protein